MRLIACLTLFAWACDSDDPAMPLVVDPDAAPVDAQPDVQRDPPDQAVAGPRLIHVGAGSDPRPPDGSRERPYPDAAGAFAVAEPGDVVFLLDGEHVAIAGLPAGVELLGAGPETTRVMGPLRLAQADAVVSGFTLTGGGLTIAEPAQVSDLVVRGAPTPALIVEAAADLRTVRVEQPLGMEPAVQVRAALRWSGGGVAGSPASAVWAEQADLTLTDLDLDDSAGFGIYAEGGRHLVRGLRVRGAAGAGARFLRAETELIDCGVADIATSENVGSGVGFIEGTGTVDGCEVVDAERGLRAAVGARLAARNVRVIRARGNGLTVNGEAEGVFRGVVVDAARSGGVSVVRGLLELHEATIRDGRRHGVLVSESTATHTDVEISGGEARGLALLRSTATVTGGSIRGAGDVCVQVTDPLGANTLSGLSLTDCGGAGLSVFGAGEGGAVTLRDTTISGVTLGADGFAAGVHLYEGAATMAGLTIRGGTGEGIRFENATGRVDGATIEDHPAPGISVIDPSAPVVVNGLIARRNGGAGVLVVGGSVDLGAPQISDTVAAAGVGPGDGVAAPFQADLTVRGGRVEGSANHGIQVDGLSTVRLREAVESANNSGFGVYVGCGSTLEIPFAYTAEGNARGAESVCR